MATTLEQALMKVDAASADATAMLPMDRYIATQLALDEREIYSIRVGAIGRLRKQAQQSDRAAAASVVVVIYRSDGLVEPTKRHAPKILGLDKYKAIIVLVVPPGTKTVSSWTVFEPAAGTVTSRLQAAGHVVSKVVVVPTKPGEPPVVTASQVAFALPIPDGARLVIDERIRRMLRLAIASSRAVMLIGPPGTGKTTLLEETFAEAKADPASYGLSSAPVAEPLQVTPEEGWTTRELVGGETVDDRGRLRFRPGHVLDAIENDRWLILDEANRADMDRIFGGLLTFLSGKSVTLGRASGGQGAAEITLGWSDAFESEVDGRERLETGVGAQIRFLAGRDWRLLGTYNALDAHRVFRFGQALGRRFARVAVPAIGLDAFAEALEPHLDALAEQSPDLDRVRVESVLCGLYRAHLDTPPVVGPALFLAVPGYIASGLALSPAADDVALELDRLLVEGYLLGAGPLLAQLDPVSLAAFHERVVTTEALINEDQWTFLSSLLAALS